MKYIEEKNRFYVLDDHREVGEITFSRAGDSMFIIDHTAVNPSHRGQGIAEKLVKLVVDKAVKEDKLIIPLCPFAAREFDNKEEYQKVLKK